MTNGAGQNDKGSAPSQVQSVDRAIAILYLLAERGTAGVTEVAAELGVHKSTAFRLIMALENGDLVEQVEERGKYHLGRGILRLAGATTAHLELPTESRPVCKRLAVELGETVNLAIIDTGEATKILQEYGSSAITGRNWIGQRTPLHATASGKVLLTWGDPTETKEALAAVLERYTPATITDPAVLDVELQQAREQGWASTVEEFEVGLNAVAAPIRNAAGDVVASVGVSGPSYRLTVESFPEVAERLLDGAREISARLGYFGAAQQ
ncbi:IclR family transcriptional regulator [Pseudonocardia nigra]|uniref:IclR family transcriptional regulator n=1 Tax=Pseudonocardia nigra TaxID=1921578 RepID=UPI0027E2F456|nr:IclR family transcriptional regulator [Pseudonocardia nigra]